jgi:hypothetical protein
MTAAARRWSGCGLRRAVTPFAAVGLLFLVSPVPATDAGVEWSGGRLSVQARNQSIGAVLKDIQRRTGIAVTSYDALSEPVARGFDRLPLAVGLKKLLSQHNHMIIEGSGRRPLRVYVLGGSALVLDLPAGAPSAEVAVPIAAGHRSALASTDPATRIEAVEHLAELNDADSLAALRQALTDPSEAVRAVAQQALAGRTVKPTP